MLLDLNMDDLTGVLNYVAESDCACHLPWPFDEKADCVVCAARRLIGKVCDQAAEDPHAVVLRAQWPAIPQELTDDDKRAIVLEHHQPGQDT